MQCRYHATHPWPLANALFAFFDAFKAPHAAVNISWLEDFLTLAESGNFSRAAEERHMTQPAFSRRIRALEEWLGTPLFDRSTQPARLTEAGEWLRGTAEDLLARVARIPGEARAVAEASAATLRLAATHALSFNFLPGWLRSLEPHTSVGPVRLLSDVLQHCEAQLLQSQVQFVLCHAQPQAPGALDAAALPFVVVGADRLVPVQSPGRNRAGLDARRKPGAAVDLLGYSAESGIGRIVQAVHGAALDRLGARAVFTAHLASVLKTMALDGRGIAWLPHSLVQDELAQGRLVPAGGDAWEVPLQIRLYRGAARLSTAAEALWAAARAAAPTAPTP